MEEVPRRRALDIVDGTDGEDTMERRDKRLKSLVHAYKPNDSPDLEISPIKKYDASNSAKKNYI